MNIFVTRLAFPTIEDIATDVPIAKNRHPVMPINKYSALEALLRNGSINLMCKYVFESSMSRVRSEALLKTINRVLAKEDGRKISEISRAIKRKEGTTRNMLERLCDIDLIVKEDKL